jgi:endoglucanase
MRSTPLFSPGPIDTIKEVRSIDPRHTLIAGGVNWNHIRSLAALRLPSAETNLIGTFHLYEPILFTHQAAEWMTPDHGTTGVTWPGPPQTAVEPIPAAAGVAWVSSWFADYNKLPYESNPGGPAPLIELLDAAEDWSRTNRIPLWVGEFGAFDKADMDSRGNWTVFVRTEFEKRGFSWAYWEFCSVFGVFNKESNMWHETLLDALIPQS